MKNIVVGFLILCLTGCGSSSRKTNTSAHTSLTDDEVNWIVLGTMRQIHSDLKKLKTDFPQLAEIDSAKVTSNRFDYSKGWVRDSKTKGPTFKKDGCEINFRIKYPAKSTDIGQLVGSPFMRLGNGKYLKFWRLVRAERTEQTDRFITEANRIISKNISQMLNQLDHKPKDYVLRLPDKE